jgi:4-hydroxy-3-methylbut-2-enyl diphosphate reductase IspH
MFEMGKGAIDVIREKRTTGAAGFPVWVQHEVIHNELASAIEQLR